MVVADSGTCGGLGLALRTALIIFASQLVEALVPVRAWVRGRAGFRLSRELLGIPVTPLMALPRPKWTETPPPPRPNCPSALPDLTRGLLVRWHGRDRGHKLDAPVFGVWHHLRFVRRLAGPDRRGHGRCTAKPPVRGRGAEITGRRGATECRWLLLLLLLLLLLNTECIGREPKRTSRCRRCGPIPG